MGVRVICVASLVKSQRQPSMSQKIVGGEVRVAGGVKGRELVWVGCVGVGVQDYIVFDLRTNCPRSNSPKPSELLIAKLTTLNQVRNGHSVITRTTRNS